MKILIATGIYPPDIGGPATYSEALARELIKRGHEAIVVTYNSELKTQNSKLKNVNQNLKIVKISRKLPIILRYGFYKLAIFWYGRKTNIIYAQDPVSVGLPVALVSWILGKQFILKVVGDYAWEQAQNKYRVRDTLDEFLQKKYSWKIEFLRLIEKKVAERATNIITPSNYLKSVILKWGIQENKINVIYNSFDWQSLVTPRASVNAQDHDIIYSVGRLVPWKGFDRLIETMADIVKEKSTVKLIIYGDGPERENLESRIKNLGLGNHVQLLGRVDHDKLLENLQGERKFFVLNSSYEGMSHQILEAQALKVPCAVSRVGGNPEIVEDGKTGLLFEYNNKEQIKNVILSLLSDKQLVERIKENAFVQIKERHDFNKMIEKTITVLQKAS